MRPGPAGSAVATARRRGRPEPGRAPRSSAVFDDEGASFDRASSPASSAAASFSEEVPWSASSGTSQLTVTSEEEAIQNGTARSWSAFRRGAFSTPPPGPWEAATGSGERTSSVSEAVEEAASWASSGTSHRTGMSSSRAGEGEGGGGQPSATGQDGSTCRSFMRAPREGCAQRGARRGRRMCGRAGEARAAASSGKVRIPAGRCGMGRRRPSQKIIPHSWSIVTLIGGFPVKNLRAGPSWPRSCARPGRRGRSRRRARWHRHQGAGPRRASP